MPSEVEEDLLLQKGRALLRKSKRTEPGGDPRRMQTAGPGRPGPQENSGEGVEGTERPRGSHSPGSSEMQMGKRI